MVYHHIFHKEGSNLRKKIFFFFFYLLRVYFGLGKFWEVTNTKWLLTIPSDLWYMLEPNLLSG